MHIHMQAGGLPPQTVNRIQASGETRRVTFNVAFLLTLPDVMKL